MDPTTGRDKLRFAFNGYKEVSQVGNALGYMGSSRNLYNALSLRSDVVLDDDADVVLHYCNPMVYQPVPGRTNILFTMTETDPCPYYFKVGMDKADALIVPSRFCQRAFLKLDSSKPMAVVPLGFDPDVWQPAQRTWDMEKNQTLRFLWIGAPNPRKGYDHVAKAWTMGWQGQPWSTLYLKTTDPNSDGKVVGAGRNVTFDSRFLPLREMTRMVHNAHIAVLPSIGEGFGLVHLECLASGLPIITTPHSAHPEFLKDSATYCKGSVRETKSSDGTPFFGFFPDAVDLSKVMAKVMRSYPKYARRAFSGAKRVHRSHTYWHSAQALVEALENLLKHQI